MATEEERLYVEKVGLHFEQLTLPRMAGRVFGWLLISDSPEVSAEDLARELPASRSSMSGMIRQLTRLELIEPVRKPGERRDYVRIRSDVWSNSLRDRLEQAKAFRKLALQGLELLSKAPRKRRHRLEEMEAMYAFLEREIPMLRDRWEALREKLLKG